MLFCTANPLNTISIASKSPTSGTPVSFIPTELNVLGSFLGMIVCEFTTLCPGLTDGLTGGLTGGLTAVIITCVITGVLEPKINANIFAVPTPSSAVKISVPTPLVNSEALVISPLSDVKNIGIPSCICPMYDMSCPRLLWLKSATISEVPPKGMVLGIGR